MRDLRTNLAWDVLLDLSAPADAPLHERLKRALRREIRHGRIGLGSALPPSRKLAQDLGCSRWVVNEAYSQLVAEGYLEARVGSATRVRWSGDELSAHPTVAAADRSVLRFDLTPGLPDLRAFPRRQWADAVRTHALRAQVSELGYQAPEGHRVLRQLLAEYMRRARGTVASDADITLSTSVTDGVRRVCHGLLARGIHVMGCEDPGWWRLREVVRSTGMRIVPMPTDAGGMRVDVLAEHPEVRAVLTTPAHQFPRGTVLAADRRAALLRWACNVDGVILEDDYDAEFRYDRRPVGTLQGMDPSRVILFKSLSKMLSPALGIGWIVAPPAWSEALRGSDVPAALPPTLDQLAFASLLESGAYERHLRRSRQRYRIRRDALVHALAKHLPGWEISGAAAGLHLVVTLPPATEAQAVVRAAAARSVQVAHLGDYFIGDSDEHGLVVGYGNLADTAVEPAVTRLATAVRST
ncbi:GntR family transcriptional regulator [Nonomuraea sp. TT08I-71]|nr:GntR family transcriptional regulator [Nonomuraea sp. TT08I-71]